MLVIRKKNIIVGLLVVLLIVIGYLNFWFNQNTTPAVKPDNRPQPVTGRESTGKTLKRRRSNFY